MRTWTIGLLVAGLAWAGCGEQKSFSQKAREAAEEPRPKVPYVVSGSKNSNTANLWSDAERSAAKPAHKIPSGTKVKILETKELDRSRGGTVYRVKAVTGEEGWIPEKFVEFRVK